MSLYNANGQVSLTPVAGSSITGLYNANGNWNVVLTTESTSIKGFYHPCGAVWGTVVTDPSLPFHAADGSVNIINNGDGTYYIGSIGMANPAAPIIVPAMMRGVNLAGNNRSLFPNSNTWPTTTGLNYYLNKGMNAYRIVTLKENLVGTGMSGPFNAAVISQLDALVAAITANGSYAIVDLHQAGRFWLNQTDYATGVSAGHIIGEDVQAPVSALADIWSRLATRYQGNSHVFFNIMNEPNAQTTTTLVSTYNTVIAAIRATGANNLILIDGNDFSNAFDWVTQTGTQANNAVQMLNIVDSKNNYAFDIHQYLDNAGGTTFTCVLNQGVVTLGDVTNWAITNNKRLFLGEFGVAENTLCESELKSMVDFVEANSINVGGPWIGWSYFDAYAGQATYSGSPTSPTTAEFLPIDPGPAGAYSGLSSDYSQPDQQRMTILTNYITARSPFTIGSLGATKIRAWFKPNTATVSAWNDSTTNARNFVQATGANQPTLNGIDGLQFTPTQFMDNTSLPAGAGTPTSNELVFAVFTLPASPTGDIDVITVAGVLPGREIYYANGFNMSVNDQGTSGLGPNNGVTSAVALGSKTLMAFRGATLSNTPEPGGMYMVTKGNFEDVNGHCFTAAGFTGTANTRIGPVVKNGGILKIHEMVFADKTQINSDDYFRITGRLAWDHGLQGSLPANHPYKRNPPLQP